MQKNALLSLLLLCILILSGCGSDSDRNSQEKGDSLSPRYRHERELLTTGASLSAKEFLVIEMETAAGSTTDDLSGSGTDEIRLEILENKMHELRLDLGADKDVEAQLIGESGESLLRVYKGKNSQSAVLAPGFYTLRLTNNGPGSHLLFIKPGSTNISDGCRNCALPGQNFSGAQIGNVTLDGSDLSDADLVGAQCAGASFKNTNLSNASMAAVNCPGAYFNGANLDGTNFNAANLKNADLLGAAWDQDTSAVGANLDGINSQSSFPDEDHNTATRDVMVTAEGPLYLTGASSFQYNGVHIAAGGSIYVTSDAELSIGSLSVEDSQTPHIIASGMDGKNGSAGEAGEDWGTDSTLGSLTAATPGLAGVNGQNGADGVNLNLHISELSGHLVIAAEGGAGGAGGNGGKGGSGRTATGPVLVLTGNQVRHVDPPAYLAYGADGGNGGKGGDGGKGGEIAVTYSSESSGTVQLATTDSSSAGVGGNPGAAGGGKTPPKASQVPKPGLAGSNGASGAAATLSVTRN